MAEISKDERNSVVHAKDLPTPTSPIDVMVDHQESISTRIRLEEKIVVCSQP